MSKRIKKYSRKFLNPVTHWDTGILEWNVTQEDSWIDGKFTVWDCSRKISLDFSFGDSKEADQRAKKLDILITELQQFREALADALQASYLTPVEDDDEC